MSDFPFGERWFNFTTYWNRDVVTLTERLPSSGFITNQYEISRETWEILAENLGEEKALAAVIKTAHDKSQYHQIQNQHYIQYIKPSEKE